MSLFETLTKVAIGIVVAKGVQHVTSGKSAPSPRKPVSPKPNAQKSRVGTGRAYAPDPSDMGGIMDEILGAGRSTTRKTATPSRRTTGGLGDVLTSRKTTTRTRKIAPKGGIEDVLAGGGAGGLGELLGAVLGGGALGGALGTGMGRAPTGQMAPPKQDDQDEAEAAIMLRAMIQAAKADGKLDAGEKERLMEAVGEASRAEIDFINRELQRPVNLDDLLADVPHGMEEKVYTVSVLAITLDERAEAEYLHHLAQALGLEPDEVNEIHGALQAPLIYG